LTPTQKIKSNKKLRRNPQRRLKQMQKTEALKDTIHLRQRLHHTKQHCLADFGFFANSKATLQHNFNQALTTLSNPNSQQPTNLDNNINNAVQKMAYSIRTRCFLMEHGNSNKSNYIKQIYIRNPNWNPPPAPIRIEDSITNFEKLLKASHYKLSRKHHKVNLSKLTTLQSQALKLLRQNKQLIIKPTDKNLGPALLDLDTYIIQVLQEHLLTKDYAQLSHHEANNKIETLKHSLKQLIASNQHLLTKAKLTYFNRGFKACFRIPVF
jgi:hypothetical protein